MSTFIRQSPHRFRLWLIATAALLLLTSILEAGHVHGTVTAAEDNCALCQHSIALDKVLGSAATLFIPLLLVACACSTIESSPHSVSTHSAHIRAPPAELHSR